MMSVSRITASKIQQSKSFTSRERQILDAAAKMAKPGEMVSPTVLAKHVNLNRNYVSHVIGKLKSRGEWNYQTPKRGRQAATLRIVAKPAATAAKPRVAPPEPIDRETAVIDALKAVVDQLKPLDEADRRRVMECAAAILLPRTDER